MKSLLLLLFPVLAACSFVEGTLATEQPPLADMEEPLPLHQDVDDEDARQQLPAGAFTGAYVSDARLSLEEMEDEPEGLRVARVVENSPADAAGLAEGDLILEAGGKAVRWASEWRAVELEAAPGSTLRVRYDRAGELRVAEIAVVERVRPADREPVERFREEDRVGIVVRTATEVESRAVGIGPGAGAVVVGLSRASPWRKAGLLFEDLIVKVGDKPIAHPNVLLNAIREAREDEAVAIEFFRKGNRKTVQARVSRRETDVHRVRIPVLLDIEKDRGTKTITVLLGLYKRTRTRAAWEVRVLWLFKFQGGDADRLEEVK